MPSTLVVAAYSALEWVEEYFPCLRERGRRRRAAKLQRSTLKQLPLYKLKDSVFFNSVVEAGLPEDSFNPKAAQDKVEYRLDKDRTVSSDDQEEKPKLLAEQEAMLNTLADNLVRTSTSRALYQVGSNRT